MPGTDPGSAREEAERLVAAALGVAATAARRFDWGSLAGSAPAAGPGPGWSTGTAECCVCPICRTIAALRSPTPEFAERLATGAGDLAAGIASMLRALTPPSGPAAPDDDVWHDATRATPGPGAADEPAGPRTDGYPRGGESGTEPATAPAPRAPAGAGDTTPPGEALWSGAEGDVWAAATAERRPSPPPARKPMAKKAVKRPVRKDDDAPPAAGS